MPEIGLREFPINGSYAVQCFLNYRTLGKFLEIRQNGRDLLVNISESNCDFTAVPNTHDEVEVIVQATLPTLDGVGEKVVAVVNIRETGKYATALAGKGEFSWVVTRKSDSAVIMTSNGFKASTQAVIVTP